MEKNDVVNQIYSAIHEVAGIAMEEMDEETEFVEDLGMNSLEILPMIASLEQDYGILISEKSLRDIFTVSELADTILASTRE